MRILRAQGREPKPWKNGGGITEEIACWPTGAGLGSFDWRISIALIERAGPFSCFPGIERCLMVLQGRMRLAIPGVTTTELSWPASPIRFPGDLPVSATPLDGPATDLNVMTRVGRFGSQLTRHVVSTPLTLSSSADHWFIVARSGVIIQDGQRRCELQGHDVAEYDAGEAAVSVRASGQIGEIILVEIQALPDAAVR